MEGEAIIMKGVRVVCGLAGNRHTLVERAALHVRVNEAQLWTVAAAAESVRHQGAEHAESNRVGGGLWLGDRQRRDRWQACCTRRRATYSCTMFGWASVERTSTSVRHCARLASSAHPSVSVKRFTAIGVPLRSVPLKTLPEPPVPSMQSR